MADLSPLAAFIVEHLERKIRAEELAAVPGQVECDQDHEDLAPCEPGCDVCESGFTPPCPSCGAAV